MMKQYRNRRAAIGLLAAMAMTALSACASVAADRPEPDSKLSAPVTIFLVRHAEKQGGDDPALTEGGAIRAEALSDLLRDANVAHIHSSDYRRTRDTAAPLADRLGLAVRLYDPRDLPGMAEGLLASEGTHLVVGHSNTTPQLTELLGGEGGTPIVEATEYDRLYLVRRAPDGSISTVLLRYGAPTG